MTDPVMGSDGRTYERAAIAQWLSRNPCSPLTRQPMNLASLKPNYALRAAIERFTSAKLTPPRAVAPAVYKKTTPPKRPHEPHGDHYYAIQVHNEINTIAAANPATTSQQSVQSRQGKILLSCLLCILVIIIIIIIVKEF